MSTDIAERPKQQNPARIFREQAARYAGAVLSDWVGEARAKEATGRIAAAMSAAASSSKDPAAFYKCTPQSVATCIAIAALTGIMPSTGAGALAYVVPQAPRRDEPPQLQYNLSHRGINALASRCNRTMIAVPVSMKDTVEFSEDGEISNLTRDVDDPPTTFEELRGVAVYVKQIDTGMVLYRGWMPKKLIEKRRGMSRSFNGNGQKYSPWFNWPVEMAMKTAMHYAISRGWCVIDDTEAVRALSVDQEADLDLPALPAPAIESRTDAVADLLSDDVVTPSQAEPPTNQEIGIVAEADNAAELAADLRRSLEQRIDDLDSPMGSIEITTEIDEAVRGGVFDVATSKALHKRVAAKVKSFGDMPSDPEFALER